MSLKMVWLLAGLLSSIGVVAAWQPTFLYTLQADDEIRQQRSPDGQWEAIVDETAGSLELIWQSQSYPVFPAGSGVRNITWSPDSRRLLVVRPYYQVDDQQGGYIASTQPLEIWQVRLEAQSVMSPTLLFQASQADFERDGSQQAVFGHWSPNSRYVIMWLGILSASFLADGLSPLVLDTETGQVYPVAVDSSAGPASLELSRENTALNNPRYQSWAPDSSKLAITAGGYRSAQVNKWLNLFDVASGQVTTVISKSEQIPGAVAWSPRGDLIAYAAVPAEQTNEEQADWMVFENPAIAARRIYLLDPTTGQYHRLNQVESYQDAPVWHKDGSRLYYVERNGDELRLMVADPATGQAEPVPGVSQPLELNDPMRPAVGYYGQFGREELLTGIPAEALGATVPGSQGSTSPSLASDASQPPPPTITCAEIYTAQAGDSVSQLAEKYLGDLLAYPVIVEATNQKNLVDSRFALITHPDQIEVGEQLCIPDTATTSALQAALAEGWQPLVECADLANALSQSWQVTSTITTTTFYANRLLVDQPPATALQGTACLVTLAGSSATLPVKEEGGGGDLWDDVTELLKGQGWHEMISSAEIYSQMTFIETSYSREEALCHLWIEGAPSKDYPVDCEERGLSPASCFHQAYPPEAQLWEVKLACAQH